MAVSKRLRFEVLRRDGHRCRYCGAGVSDAILTVDHVTPTALGGTDLPDNLVAACEPCNAGKTSTIPDGPTITGVAEDAVRWARAIKLAAAELEQQEQPKHDYRAAFRAAWERWGYDSGGKRVTFELDPEWATTMDRFRLAGLPSTVWTDIVETAMTSRTKLDNRFRYSCGIAWRMVTEMQERARDIIGAASAAAAIELDSFSEAVAGLWAAVWFADTDQHPSAGQSAEFRASLAALGEPEHDHAREQRVFSALHAVEYEMTDIAAALEDHARFEDSQIVLAWSDAWFCASGEWPDSELWLGIQDQCKALREKGFQSSRIRTAAVIAGSRLSKALHFGIAAASFAQAGTTKHREESVDLWAMGFNAATNRWPTDGERAEFLDHTLRIGNDGAYCVPDVFTAAAAAGVYGDADLTRCLPRYLSALEAAAVPLRATEDIRG